MTTKLRWTKRAGALVPVDHQCPTASYNRETTSSGELSIVDPIAGSIPAFRRHDAGSPANNRIWKEFPKCQ